MEILDHTKYNQAMPDIFVAANPENNAPEKKPETLPSGFPRTEAERSKFRKHSHSRFSAFNMFPEKISFATRDKEEEIILMLRQHPIVNIKWIFITLLLLTGPTLLSLFGIFSLLPAGYPLIIIMAWYLVTFAYAMEGFFAWYFNVFFVTTRRVIDVDFFNLINKRVSDAEIEKIQDVSYSTSGAIGTTFNFGDVLIQTASEITELDFMRVPNPEKVAEVLNDLRAKVH